MTDVAEIAAEQKYFDVVAERREELRAINDESVLAGATQGAQAAVRRQFEAQANELGGPHDPVAFGRIDSDDGQTLYIGRALIVDDDREPLVVSMKAPVADAFYTATIADPRGLVRKRTFRTTRNHVDALDDLVYKQIAADLEELISANEPELLTAQLDDSLLAELARHRSGELAEIAKTIQASQHAIITAPHNRLLVVQGGPGTGKTAVALHRLSWMLYRERETMTPADVLVIGPNPTFVRYIRQVLPELGDRDVPQTDIRRLLAPSGVAGGREEDAHVVKLKGDGRMAALIRKALHDRIGPDPAGIYDFALGGRNIRFTPAELDEQSARIANEAPTYRDGRERYKSWVSAEISRRATAGTAAVPPSIPPQQLDQFVDRVWPQLTERSFLRDLYTSRDRLLTAAGDQFNATEVGLLYRQQSRLLSEETFSDADLPLLDFAAIGINGAPQQYKHVVVDEAQDLSPMELRAIRRRVTTGMTIVGDIAQSTGPWARDRWDDVLELLSVSPDDSLSVLELGYRVPAEVFTLAARVLAVAAPNVPAPTPVRTGGHDPSLVAVDDGDLAASVVARAKQHSANGNSVGIICPDGRWEAVATQLTVDVDKWVDASRGNLGSAINMIRPHDAKGLEFDSVVVVDPQAIVASYERGHRMLYVALTRTTTHLDVVHLGEALPGTAPAEQSPAVPAPRPAATGQPAGAAGTALPPPRAAPNNRFVEAIASAIADDLRSAVSPAQFEAVLARVRELLADG